MKGRWFFWIPVILYGLYRIVSIIDFNNQIVINSIATYIMATSVISLIYYFVECCDNYYVFIKHIKKMPILCFAIPELCIVFGINFLFDKYLTIKL